MAEHNDVAEVVEEAAREQLGVAEWDRSAIYRESAEAATDNRLPYWAVLSLSGAIATLGLAVDSSAVVIGAMLVAPLLAPVIGLALSLAVGDGRLAVQAAAIVLGSTVAVILVGAALTALLPFHTITLEISARTRPTTLDLAIAVLSGLVGAVVTVARRSRLSAAIPGVAISVALIPPLAVAGFGLGSGRAGVVRGSLLLYGANLAGIVLSGMAVFLLVGMHRAEVLEAARSWHDSARAHGVARLADRLRWVRTLGVFRSAWGRSALVVMFVLPMGLPLSESLAEITRETRVERAVRAVADELFDRPGHSAVLDRQVVIGPDRTQVYLRVATTEWFGQPDSEEFEREASAQAREPVRLTLEQLPARGDDLQQAGELLPGLASPRGDQHAQPESPSPPAVMSELLGSARARLAQVLDTVSLPEDVHVRSAEIVIESGGDVSIRMSYAAAVPLDEQATQMLRGQLTRALGLPGLRIDLQRTE